MAEFGSPTIHPGIWHQLIFTAVGDPAQAPSLTAVFMSGVCARVCRERLHFKAAFFIPAFLICILAILLLPQPFTMLAVGSCGVYALLFLAIGIKSPVLQSINNKYDFSYGIYLYAWPIASLLILGAQKINWPLAPSVLTALTAIFATLVAVPSWYLIEKPALGLKFRRMAGVRLGFNHQG
ncbi:MAG TPA: hypothetical protein VFX22_04365 [Candidatus Kapabacteria bacterium]|nr:hypothetical protein [Candidatus Kapabacteria bacterium]